MNKRLMLVAALTFVLGARVMAHEGEDHGAAKKTEQAGDAEHKEHADADHKAHGHKDKKDKKGPAASEGAKDAKDKKSAKKKKDKNAKEEPKGEMPAGMPMK